MPNSSENDFNFEEWSTLASTDPEKFEQLRKARIADFIASTSKERQHRLKGLQWQIDRTREKHKGSVASCIAISKLMWQTFHQLSSLLQSHVKNEPLDISPNAPARILSFPEKATN